MAKGRVPSDLFCFHCWNHAAHATVTRSYGFYDKLEHRHHGRQRRAQSKAAQFDLAIELSDNHCPSGFRDVTAACEVYQPYDYTIPTPYGSTPYKRQVQ